MADTEDLNDYRYDKYIGEKLILDKKSNNGGNLETVVRQVTDGYGAPTDQAHRNTILDTQNLR